MTEEVASFDSFGLDPRLVRSLAVSMQIAQPTLVQAACIPIALLGKDVLAKARTGSGKTLAYLLPVIHKILLSKESDPTSKTTRALIIVPTRELAHQVSQTIKQLCVYLKDTVSSVNLSATDSTMSLLRPILQDRPDVIVATPSRLIPFLEPEEGSAGDALVDLKALESLVIDEADLVLSYGSTDEDLRAILAKCSKHVQSYLISATLNSDVKALKVLVLRNPAVLTLTEEEGAGESGGLVQSFVRIPKEEANTTRFLVLYFLLKLKVAPWGSHKTIVFVNSVETAYKCKLFLEQFGIKSVVVNEEVPVRSRVHVVEEFNRGVFDLLIATDASCGDARESGGVESGGGEGGAVDGEGMDVDAAANDEDDAVEDEDADQDAEETPTDDSTASKKRKPTTDATSKSKKKGKPSTEEYGMSRGVDFRNVHAVINFDLPDSASAYMHRVGRTARGVGRRGYALSFLVEGDEEQEIVWRRIEKRQEALETQINPYVLDMTAVNAFRYRVQDALKSVTKPLIRESRLKELKNEILNSEKLKAHFEDNPKDLAALKHDKAIHPARVQQHMKHVPDYLMPRRVGEVLRGKGEIGANKRVAFHNEKKAGRGRGGARGGGRGGARGGRGDEKNKRKGDPLKSFKV
ncbi:ATP-dependent DNA/RNA helicase [Podochytrium sp. JEL0797]|nr:ATP-dependent DNA/RNA helicase [Podochytrium sp. JEL0797]